MTEFLGTPIHPMLVHFPIAGIVFASGALLVGLAAGPKRRTAWAWGAAILLSVAVLGGVAAALTGHAWAESLGFLPGDEWIPPASVKGGLLRNHVLFTLGATVCAAVAALLAASAARKGGRLVLALLAAGLAAALVGAGGHAGGTLVHNDKAAPSPASAVPEAPSAPR